MRISHFFICCVLLGSVLQLSLVYRAFSPRFELNIRKQAAQNLSYIFGITRNEDSVLESYKLSENTMVTDKDKNNPSFSNRSTKISKDGMGYSTLLESKGKDYNDWMIKPVETKQTQKTDDLDAEIIGKEIVATSSFMQMMSHRMKERKEILSKACKLLGLDKGAISKIRMLPSEKYKIAYCYIPKAGCTNTKKLMLQLSGYNTSKFGGKDIHKLSQLLQLTGSKVPSVILEGNYTKFLLVREPFERLVSSYNDKIGDSGDKDFKKYSNKMRSMYGNSTRREEKEARALLGEFIDYISNGHNDGDNNGGELHWSNYNSICYPCLIDYDVIMHIETIHEDWRYLLKRIGAPPNLVFGQGYHKTGHSKTFSENYVNKYIKELNATQKQRLYEAYESDFLLFNYSADLLRKP